MVSSRWAVRSGVWQINLCTDLDLQFLTFCLHPFDFMQFPDPIPPQGIPVPLRVAFTGIKNVPLIALATNSAAPKLILFEDLIEKKVIVTRIKPLTAVQMVEITSVPGGFQIEFTWKDSLLTFCADIGRGENLPSILDFLRRKNVFVKDKKG